MQGTHSQKIRNKEAPWRHLCSNPLASVLCPSKFSPREKQLSESGYTQDVFWVPNHCGSYFTKHWNVLESKGLPCNLSISCNVRPGLKRLLRKHRSAHPVIVEQVLKWCTKSWPPSIKKMLLKLWLPPGAQVQEWGARQRGLVLKEGLLYKYISGVVGMTASRVIKLMQKNGIFFLNR